MRVTFTKEQVEAIKAWNGFSDWWMTDEQLDAVKTVGIRFIGWLNDHTED